LCFDLDLDEQQASGFRYDYSVCQAEYSRNLIFASDARMDRVFGTSSRDRSRSLLDVPSLRILFGVKQRPAGTAEPSMKLAVVIEKPEYDLTKFKVHFGLLTLKGHAKGERVLRFEAIVHNTKTLKTGRGLDKFPGITARLVGMASRFCTMLDCVDTGFIPDGTLDELPLPARIGAVRTGGIDLDKPRTRAALAAALALAPAPGGFTVADFAARVQAMTGQETYTIRQAAYDLRKLRGKNLAVKPGTTRRYQIPPGRRPHHHRVAHPPRPHRRADPRWGAQPPHGPQARALDGHRPRLRNSPHRHADPVPRPGHRNPSGRIDNILSIGELQAARDQGSLGAGLSARAARSGRSGCGSSRR
jgi:hypothetical protein